MDKITEIQKRILSDADARKAFCADPAAFLKNEGVTLPEGIKLPASLSVEGLEAQIAQVEARLAKQGISLADASSEHLKKGLLGEAELEAVAGGGGSDEMVLVVVALIVPFVVGVTE